EADERPRRTVPRPEIADRSAIEPLAREARRRQPGRNEIERAAIGGRHGAARDELPRELERVGVDGGHARSSSLIDVFARVCASTRFTITAHDSAYLPSGEGRLPGTTTDPDGTLP